jgi:hypothetical protein
VSTSGAVLRDVLERADVASQRLVAMQVDAKDTKSRRSVRSRYSVDGKFA